VLEWFLFSIIRKSFISYENKIYFAEKSYENKIFLLKNLTHVVTAFRYFAKLWNT